MQENQIHSDVLIIGSGIAGLSCALKLSDHFNVTMITKGESIETNTRYAQGGIASVMSGTDNFNLHIQDTLTAGAGLCDMEVVKKIISDGPKLVGELIEMGVRFNQENDHSYSLGKEGGHSERRILHAGDTTGNEIEQALLRQVKSHPRIRIFEFHCAIDLILSEKLKKPSKPNRCLGVFALDTKSKKVFSFTAEATILASGGAGKTYLYTSNPDIATGDGIAMAYRAGATVANLEFVQFHPTCLYNPGGWNPGKKSSLPKTFLITEALRGEGAILKRADGTAFMGNYHELKDLAPRDIVARAIDAEMKKHGDDCVFLDATGLNADFIKERFPNIYSVCLEHGIDITKQAIPVVPAAHYFCGGVKTDLNGQTDLSGLYAIGETACTGLHGANRLASNSLLEAVAMADYVSTHIEGILKTNKRLQEVSVEHWDETETTPSDEAVVITQNWEEIRRTMWNYVGIVRTNKRLARAQKRIELFQDEIKDYYKNYKVTRDFLELRNLALVCELIINSAIKRHESRGLHYNLDYPKTVQAELKDTLIKKA